MVSPAVPTSVWKTAAGAPPRRRSRSRRLPPPRPIVLSSWSIFDSPETPTASRSGTTAALRARGHPGKGRHDFFGEEVHGAQDAVEGQVAEVEDAEEVV